MFWVPGTSIAVNFFYAAAVTLATQLIFPPWDRLSSCRCYSTTPAGAAPCTWTWLPSSRRRTRSSRRGSESVDGNKLGSKRTEESGVRYRLNQTVKHRNCCDLLTQRIHEVACVGHRSRLLVTCHIAHTTPF